MRRLKEIKWKCAQFRLTRAGDAKHKINLFRPYLTLEARQLLHFCLKYNAKENVFFKIL